MWVCLNMGNPPPKQNTGGKKVFLVVSFCNQPKKEDRPNCRSLLCRMALLSWSVLFFSGARLRSYGGCQIFEGAPSEVCTVVAYLKIYPYTVLLGELTSKHFEVSSGVMFERIFGGVLSHRPSTEIATHCLGRKCREAAARFPLRPFATCFYGRG